MSAYTVAVKGVLYAPFGEVSPLLNEREEWESFLPSASHARLRKS